MHKTTVLTFHERNSVKNYHARFRFPLKTYLMYVRLKFIAPPDGNYRSSTAPPVEVSMKEVSQFLVMETLEQLDWKTS